VDGEFEVSPSGTWRLLARALKAPDASRSDYPVLRELLLRARQQHTDKTAVAAQIKESVPALGDVGDFLKSRSGVALATWLAVLVAILNLIITSEHSSTAPAPSQVVNVQVGGPSEQQIEEWIKDALAKQSPPAVTAPAQVVGSAPARNLPCPCGSGVKYKKCCGAPGSP
jgi:hypothetical protein